MGLCQMDLGAYKKIRAVEKVSKVPSETYEQIKLVLWLEKMGLRFYAVPNGGSRPIVEAVKFKRSGVKAGVPDLCLPFPSGAYHGLYIELKRVVGGKVSPEQREWIEYLNGAGYYAVVCKGFEAAKKAVEFYLGLGGKIVA